MNALLELFIGATTSLFVGFSLQGQLTDTEYLKYTQQNFIHPTEIATVHTVDFSHRVFEGAVTQPIFNIGVELTFPQVKGSLWHSATRLYVEEIK